MNLVFILLITTLAILQTNAGNPEKVEKNRPNIVILLADDLGYGDLGCYGNLDIKTSNLDKLSADGIRFMDCYASAPMCSPSRAGLLTGRNPYRTGVYDWIAPDSAHYLNRNEITIASLLRDVGYETGLFGKWHLNGKMGTDEQPQPDDFGFDYHFATQYSANHLAPQGFYRNGKKLYQQHGYSCDIVVNDAVKWLKNLDSDKPFFQYIAFHETHEPIASPPDLLEIYCQAGKKALYYSNVANLDRAIGKYMEALKSMGLEENTLIIFTSDNGPAQFAKGYFERSYGSTNELKGRKRHLWEGGIRIPGMMKWQGNIPAGSVSDDPISNVDFLPTICAVAGIDLPKNTVIDGSDISPLFKNMDIQRATPLNWHFYAPVKGPNSVLRDGDWILTSSWDGGEYSRGRFRLGYIDDIKSGELTDFKLYNIRKDIRQDKNIADDNPEVFKKLKKQLINLHKEMKEAAPVSYK